MRHVIILLLLASLVPGCRSEETVAELAALRARNEALESRVETLEQEAKERTERLQALEHAVADLKATPAPSGSPVDIVPRSGLSDDQRERLNEVGVKMLEQMQEDGTLDRAGELGIDALKMMLEAERDENEAAEEPSK